MNAVMGAAGLVTCATCDGTGRLENDADSLFTPMWRICPACKGDGEVPEPGAADGNTVDVSGEVPEAFARLGFSGLFGLVATLPEDDAAADALVARMPYFTPGQADRIITLREGDRDPDGRRTAVMVVRDDVAFMATVTRRSA